jgi:hypothetical protein
VPSGLAVEEAKTAPRNCDNVSPSMLDALAAVNLDLGDLVLLKRGT